jgi:hypothetical protein
LLGTKGYVVVVVVVVLRERERERESSGNQAGKQLITTSTFPVLVPTAIRYP